MSHSYMTTIGEIAEVFDGPHATPKKLPSGPYFLSISSLDKGRLDLTKSAFLSEEDFKKWTKRVTPKEGDLLFSYETRLGEAALMPAGVRACLGRRMGLLRFNKAKVMPEYALYAYLSPAFQQTIKANTLTGATVDRLSISEFPNFPIRIPPLEEQKKVADLLGSIDKKIALNNRINAELEGMAKTLYDYWFVQFDFPDANGKPYKTSGGKMAYNATLKREIPAGWAVKTLSQIADITMGQSPAGETYNENGIGTLFFQGSTDFGWLFPTPRQYTTSPARMAKKGDILLSVRAPVGDMNIANADCCIGRGLAALNSKSGSDGFLFYVMKYFKQVFERRNAEGTTFGSITKDDLHSLQVVCPEPELLKRYDGIVSEYNKMIFTRSFENQDLIKLRDWLLPLLMNGQVTVK
ncbi:restriction endonuclease subunit S [Escherichia coli]|nr:MULTISPECIES: restriction endonuclease subunit S [Enterobacteriaceae]EFA5403790.1 restriction endonuclease subunit S [Escherichia coli O109]EGF2680765.1 restriction endonuclease subunit S [Shigella sonnei]HAT1623068.1 restriction endonuclease subunit S [Raoultella planticola]EEV5960115.1 restriction endonuclease subunit S [Escherichia coli]EEV6966914.1 restriction endonuclease subunit S [Escherichia coli]